MADVAFSGMHLPVHSYSCLETFVTSSNRNALSATSSPVGPCVARSQGGVATWFYDARRIRFIFFTTVTAKSTHTLFVKMGKRSAVPTQEEDPGKYRRSFHAPLLDER